MSVSCDPVQGKDRRKADFWEAVLEKFNILESEVRDWEKEEKRVVGAIKSQWGKISSCLSLWHGVWKLTISKAISGFGAEDYLKKAHELYKEKGKGEFTFEDAWKAVRHSPKWFTMLGPEDTVTESERSASEEQISGPRPPGNKRSKDAVRAKSVAAANRREFQVGTMSVLSQTWYDISMNPPAGVSALKANKIFLALLKRSTEHLLGTTIGALDADDDVDFDNVDEAAEESDEEEQDVTCKSPAKKKKRKTTHTQNNNNNQSGDSSMSMPTHTLNGGGDGNTEHDADQDNVTRAGVVNVETSCAMDGFCLNNHYSDPISDAVRPCEFCEEDIHKSCWFGMISNEYDEPTLHCWECGKVSRDKRTCIQRDWLIPSAFNHETQKFLTRAPV
jgi:hypothetical protein